ncbi:MAG: hypothetical protein MK135_06545 [Polyangiaceae bacterium]|nr:hypothetical protein [Polyangiaceae bacterium]
MTNSQHLMAFVQKISKRLDMSRDFISIDALGEAIGTDQASYEEIDALIHWLEEQGHEVGDATGASLKEALQRVLMMARKLKSEGREASQQAIATELGITPREVRVALLYAEVLAR